MSKNKDEDNIKEKNCQLNTKDSGQSKVSKKHRTEEWESFLNYQIYTFASVAKLKQEN